MEVAAAVWSAFNRGLAGGNGMAIFAFATAVVAIQVAALALSNWKRVSTIPAGHKKQAPSNYGL